MLILSQDKKTIINFEGITRVSIVPPVEKGYKYSIAINGCLDLGYYDTEERAKEVLQEIINEYKSQNYLVYDPETGSIKDVNKNIVFIMPEE